MYYDSTGNARLFYEIKGKGFPIFMLHGNMQNYSALRAQADLLSDQFCVISVDSRGHGKSTHGEIGLSLDLLAMDIIGIADALHLKSFHIFGFSDGANIAMRIAFRCPERVKLLILISPNTKYSGLKKLYRIFLDRIKKFLFFFRKIDFINKRYQIFSLMINEENMGDEEIAMLKMPALILTGKYDIIHGRHIRHIQKLMPNGVLYVIPKAGHMTLLFPKKHTNKKILDFLEKMDGSEG